MMANKKVAFGTKAKKTVAVEASPDKWVDTGNAAEDKNTFRFTIDLPSELHKRIKIHCTLNSLTMKDRIIEILEEQFPPLPKGFKD
jgi:hypothetical protein